MSIMNTNKRSYSIKFCRLVEEGLLEVLLVNGARVDAEHHEHLAGIADGQPVHYLAAPLARHQLQQRLPQVVADAPVPHHLHTHIFDKLHKNNMAYHMTKKHIKNIGLQ